MNTKLVFVLLLIAGTMASSQLRPPSSAGGSVSTTDTKFTSNASDAGGDVTFTNLSNAQAEDGVFSVAPGGDNGLAIAIASDTYGFSVPLAATIDSVYVRIKQKQQIPAGLMHLGEIDLSDGVLNSCALFEGFEAVSSTNVYRSIGISQADWFSCTTIGVLTPALVNGSGFAADAQYTADDLVPNDLSVDAIRIDVKYHVTTAGSSSTKLGTRQSFGISVH